MNDAIAVYVCTFLCLVSILVNIITIKKFSAALSARRRDEHRRELKLFKLYESLEEMIEEFEHLIFTEQKNYIVNRKYTNKNKLNLVFDEKIKEEENVFEDCSSEDNDLYAVSDKESYSGDHDIHDIKNEFVIDNIIDGTKIISSNQEEGDFEIQEVSHTDEILEVPREIDEDSIDNISEENNYIELSEKVYSHEIETSSAPKKNNDTENSNTDELISENDKNTDTLSLKQNKAPDNSDKSKGTNGEIEKMLREGQKVTVIAEMLGRSVAEIVLIKEMMNRD